MTSCNATCINYLYLLKFNTLRPRQNGRHFADDIFNGIFLNANVWMLIKFSLKFVPKGPIHNIPALVQIMAWRRPGDKPLSEPMVVSLLTHICVTRPQWVNYNTNLVIGQYDYLIHKARSVCPDARISMRLFPTRRNNNTILNKICAINAYLKTEKAYLKQKCSRYKDYIFRSHFHKWKILYFD